MSPCLSLVVAVYNVRPWVSECLDSIAALAPEGAEVVVVDDGSTDGSGSVCDEAAVGRPLWRVIHQPNRGLGAARNVGLDAARGEYVGFVDGDDFLLAGYPRLLELATRESLSVVTGGVERTDGTRATASPLHVRALAPLGTRANMRRDHSLVFDTAAWNKVYGRAFLQRHGLRFPEGVLYEDMAFTMAALFHAGTVGVVPEPVYAWRSRGTGLSITQRRFELDNLQDRFRAVEAVDTFLQEQHLPALVWAHDRKVLQVDLPLYTAALPEADATFRSAYLEFMDYLDRDLSDDVRDALPPTLRLYVRLAQDRRLDDLLVAVRGRRASRPWAQDERSLARRVDDDLRVCRLELRYATTVRQSLLVGRGFVGRTVRLVRGWSRSAR